MPVLAKFHALHRCYEQSLHMTGMDPEVFGYSICHCHPEQLVHFQTCFPTSKVRNLDCDVSCSFLLQNSLRDVSEPRWDEDLEDNHGNSEHEVEVWF